MRKKNLKNIKFEKKISTKKILSKVFGCGLADKLGIGVYDSISWPNITKLILPDDVKIKTISRLSSSSNTHCIQTEDYRFWFGLNENQRLSTKLFKNQPKVAVPAQEEHSDEYSSMNFDDFTFLAERDHKRNSFRIRLQGAPVDVIPYITASFGENLQVDGGSVRYPRPFPRSFHKKADLLCKDVIDTKKLSSFLSTGPPTCDEEFECTSLKAANYMNFQIFLQKTMKIFLNKEQENEDSRILGLSLSSDLHRGSWNSKVNVFKEILLEFCTDEGNFKYFRNIFNGPYSTIALTQNMESLGWGKNDYNMLGMTGKEMNQEIVFPPKIIRTLPSVVNIKQISIGFQHTLVLLQNSTVLGIGSNSHGELGRYDFNTTNSWIPIQFGDDEQKCLTSKTCTVEFVAAEKDVSFFAFNYGSEKHVQMTPMCFSKSHLDIDACSFNGFCVDNEKCECFDGYYGENCNLTFSCPLLSNCSGNGYCTQFGNCSCSYHATGPDCSIPVCNYFFLPLHYNFD